MVPINWIYIVFLGLGIAAQKGALPRARSRALGLKRAFPPTMPLTLQECEDAELRAALDDMGIDDSAASLSASASTTPSMRHSPSSFDEPPDPNEGVGADAKAVVDNADVVGQGGGGGLGGLFLSLHDDMPWHFRAVEPEVQQAEGQIGGADATEKREPTTRSGGGRGETDCLSNQVAGSDIGSTGGDDGELPPILARHAGDPVVLRQWAAQASAELRAERLAHSHTHLQIQVAQPPLILRLLLQPQFPPPLPSCRSFTTH